MRTNTASSLTSQLNDQTSAANDNQYRSADSGDLSAADLQLVRQLAGTLAKRLPSHIEVAELISLGNLGLVEARRRWNPSRGVPFPAFATPRIRGAMIDALRSEDPVSRGERGRLQQDLDLEASVRLVDIERAVDFVVDEERLPVDCLVQHQDLERMRGALSCLRERERHVVERHFFAEQSLRSIGEELGVTESRACQIVSGALAKLRTHLEEAA